LNLQCTTCSTRQYGRSDLSGNHCSIRGLDAAPHLGLRTPWGQQVNPLYICGAVACIGVFVYLIYALIKAEDF
jgi:K+-transporting ATPase KdpF subunit